MIHFFAGTATVLVASLISTVCYPVNRPRAAILAFCLTVLIRR